MKVQVKKSGGSLIIILPYIFVRNYELKEGDEVNISDIFKVKKQWDY